MFIIANSKRYWTKFEKVIQTSPDDENISFLVQISTDVSSRIRWTAFSLLDYQHFQKIYNTQNFIFIYTFEWGWLINLLIK